MRETLKYYPELMHSWFPHAWRPGLTRREFGDPHEPAILDKVIFDAAFSSLGIRERTLLGLFYGSRLPLADLFKRTGIRSGRTLLRWLHRAEDALADLLTRAEDPLDSGGVKGYSDVECGKCRRTLGRAFFVGKSRLIKKEKLHEAESAVIDAAGSG